MTSVLMETTEGLTWATTSAILGISPVCVADDGGVHSGLIGVGDDKGTVGDFDALSGELMVIQPVPMETARVSMRMNVKNDFFKFSLFISNCIIAYARIVKILLKFSPLSVVERGGYLLKAKFEFYLNSAGTSGSSFSASLTFSSGYS